MLESPVYKDILAEGWEKGREEGRQEGREEGEQARLAADVLEVLEVRFGSVPAALAARVREQKGLEILQALHRRAIQVDSLAQFEREMLPGPA